jgi:galactitol PTS system EIIA component
MATLPIVNEALILPSLPAYSSQEVIVHLAEPLKANQYVAPSYPQAVIEREREFPTGLPTEIPVALPHTEARHCYAAGIAVATLDQPVTFRQMGAPDSLIDVEMVFMLAISDPKAQVEWLKRLIDFFQGKGNLSALKRFSNSAQMAQFLRTGLGV